jgi:glyceraldehyde 3-phosphate dehydrogenase
MPPKIRIGINGFGRIGKSLLINSFYSNNIDVVAVNAPDFRVETIKSYIGYDSAHGNKYKNILDIEVISGNTFGVNGKRVTVLDKRVPTTNMWSETGVDYILETTGKFLTKAGADKHIDGFSGFIMCSPPKDDTPQFVVGGNHEMYAGEPVISNASCTTNCIVPVLKVLGDISPIECVSFLTVHAATASQNVIDGVHLKSRIHRSVLNNIIPHTTGASSSIVSVLPELSGKIFGSSVRVPTNNVSMVDLNVRFRDGVSLDEALNRFRCSQYVDVNEDPHLVSSDFMTSSCPSIVDEHYCTQMGDKELKIGVWYDNEWSYSAQVLRLVEHISTRKQSEHIRSWLTHDNFH